jgi:hypothetical protein
MLNLYSLRLSPQPSRFALSFIVLNDTLCFSAIVRMPSSPVMYSSRIAAQSGTVVTSCYTFNFTLQALLFSKTSVYKNKTDRIFPAC